MRLVIGAGDRRLDGFRHHDIQDLPGLDYVCDFWDLADRLNEPCEEIHMTHVLEHFPFGETHTVLTTINQMLEEGGKLYIEVPNFYWHAQQITADPRNRKIIEYAFGGQLNEWDYHYNGFTPQILREDLEAAGFRILELKPNSSIEVWAVK